MERLSPVGVAALDRHEQALAVVGVAQVARAHVVVVAVAVDLAHRGRRAALQRLVDALAIERIAHIQRARVVVVALAVGGAAGVAALDLRVGAGAVLRDAVVGSAAHAV